MPQRNRIRSKVLRRLFRVNISPNKKTDPHVRSSGVIRYTGIPLIFAVVLALVFHSNLQKISDHGGDIANIMEGTFTILLSLIFAVIGVYLVIHVLHPYFGKRPVPTKLKNVATENDAEDITVVEFIELAKDLRSDREVEEYLDTIVVKADIAVTLGFSLAAFFFGMYGYMASSTVGYDASPNFLWISLCFMFLVFSIVYTILKTMKVVWDV